MPMLADAHISSLGYLWVEWVPSLSFLFFSPNREPVHRLRNFAAFSSEAKVRYLIAEIRVISLISANFVCISFAQHCINKKTSEGVFAGCVGVRKNYRYVQCNGKLSSVCTNVYRRDGDE